MGRSRHMALFAENWSSTRIWHVLITGNFCTIPWARSLAGLLLDC